MTLRALRCLLAALVLFAPVALHAADRAKSEPTIRDVSKRAVEIKTNSSVGPSPSKAMENYRKFLELQKTDPRLRAEALRRLGDLNLETGELDRLESEVTREDLAGGEAIKLYSTLLKAYPDYPRNDQVLYQLARAYETTGRPEQALATLDEVVKRYPDTPNLAEVQFRRGEILFSAKRYKESENAYVAVIRQGKAASAGRATTFYQQSLYKHGWSLFKQGLNEDSLPSFAELLDSKLVKNGKVAEMEALSRPDREISEDTLRVMAITFSYTQGAQSLDEFVSKRGNPEYSYLLYSRLGDLYVEKQRYQDAATTYRAYAERVPNEEHSPGLSMQAIEAYRKGGFAQLVLDGKREYVENYNFDAPFWQGRERAKYPSVVNELKTNLKDVAEYFHAAAQKSKRVEDYQQAARWYRSELKSFPDDPESAQNNFLLAEALFESKQYADAATEYERTAYDYPRNARSATAAHASLEAYSRQEANLGPVEKATRHRQSIDAGIRFAKSFPEHQDSSGVLARAAQDLYTLKELPRAGEVAQLLLAAQPPADQAKRRIAWTVVGQVGFDQGAYDKAETAWLEARNLTTDKNPQKDDERANLTDRIATAVYKQAESKQRGGDGAGAVEDFLRVARLAPESKIRATSQYDAAAALIGLKDWPRAIDVLEGYRRDFPKSEYDADITRKLAVAYAEANRPALAAAEFEKIYASTGEEPAVRREALTQATELHAKAGNRARSIALLEKAISEYPTPLAQSMETRQRLADFARDDKNSERLRYWQREIVKADSTAGNARSDRTRYLAGKAQLALAEPARDSFRAVRLVAPLKSSLAAKRRSLETALQGYKDAAAYNVAEVTTMANFEMAELYRRLAKDLMDSERPKKLNADEKEQYDILLEEQAFPFEEQSIKLHETNAGRAQEGLYDDGVRASYRALAELKPARYGKTELAGGIVRTFELQSLAAVEGASAPPARASADFQRAVGLVDANRTTDAQLEFQRLIDAWPQAGGAAFNAGVLARSAGALEQSEGFLATATQRTPRNAATWNELGVTRRQRGNFKEALAAYEQAIQIDPSFAPAHRNHAVLLDLYIGDAQGALSGFERYKALTGEDKPVSGWIADVKQRLGIRESRPEVAPASDSTPAPQAVAAPAQRAPEPEPTPGGKP
ncbi:MAG: tetratricopeptide repeat protein [Steroidobacteraceae bacterium]